MTSDTGNYTPCKNDLKKNIYKDLFINRKIKYMQNPIFSKHKNARIFPLLQYVKAYAILSLRFTHTTGKCHVEPLIVIADLRQKPNL